MFTDPGLECKSLFSVPHISCGSVFSLGIWTWDLGTAGNYNDGHNPSLNLWRHSAPNVTCSRAFGVNVWWYFSLHDAEASVLGEQKTVFCLWGYFLHFHNSYKNIKKRTFSQVPALSVGETCYLASPDFTSWFCYYTLTSWRLGLFIIQWENNKPAFRLLWRSNERTMSIFQSGKGTLIIISTVDQGVFACRSG